MNTVVSDSEADVDNWIDMQDVEARRMKFRQVVGDEGDSGLIVNKMARVYTKGELWTRNKDTTVSLKPGHMFISKEDAIIACKDNCIQHGFCWKRIKSSKTRYTQQCANEGCTFRIHCSVLVDRVTWMVKTVTRGHVGSCGPLENNRTAGSRWVANRLLDHYKMSSNLTVEGMRDYCLKTWGISPPDYICTRAKKLMRAIVEGKHEEGYNHLPAYCEEFKARNVGSVCMIKWIDQGPKKSPVFKHLAICIDPAISSFKLHFRPLIGIDATHLKGPYRGVLLTAMSLDGNNWQFPLTYAVVEKENAEEWTFFLRALVQALDCAHNQSKYTIISDRHRGIIKALSNVMPTATRRICVFHFYKNFASSYPGAWFHAYFYMAANAYAKPVFERAMKKIQEMNNSAYVWLRDNENVDLWARCKFDEILKCDDNTNNFVESFNHAIIKFRGKSTLTMLEEIRKLIGRRFVKRFERAQKWDGVLVPFVEKKLKEIDLESRDCTKVTNMGGGNFDVWDGVRNMTVRFSDRFCNCRKWQVTGLPCKHALRCINKQKQKVEDHCDAKYTVTCYMKCYDQIIHPIADPIMWEDRDLPLLDPPKTQIKKGRPPLHRRRESPSNSSEIRISGSLRCSKCKVLGHNSRSCGKLRDDKGELVLKRNRPPRPTDEEGRPLKRGRPKKVVETSTRDPQLLHHLSLSIKVILRSININNRLYFTMNVYG